jgi:hypothetical protein
MEAKAVGAAQGGERQRRKRRDAGQARIQERDVELLGWIADQYAIRFDQLKQLGDLKDTSAEWVLRRWKQFDWVLAERLAPNEAPWIWLTEAGTSIANRDYPLWTPRTGGLTQILAINAVRLQLERAHPNGRWTSERAQRHILDATGGPASRERVPDSVWQTTLDGPRIAVEVLLADMGAARLAALVEELLSRYAEVLIYGADTIWVAVTRLTRLRHWDRVTVDLLPAS